MSKQLTVRQAQERSKGMAAYSGYQSYVNTHNRIIGEKEAVNFLIQPDALSISFFSGKIYAALGSKNAPTGAASLKRSAKKRAAIRARASKR